MEHLLRAALVRAALVVALLTIAAFAFGIEADFSATETVTTELQYQQFTASLAHDLAPFHFIASLLGTNDDKYKASFSDSFWAGYYFMLLDGGLSFDLAPFHLRMGRLGHADSVSSPYSLFISSNPNRTVLAEFSYDDGRFFFSDRWLQLNYRSALYPVERGANYKVYGFHAGNLRFGFQDSVVYTERSFDPEFFFNPIPGFFLQYVNTLAGNPWQQTGNDNSILGFFLDYTAAGAWYACAQILVDDINVNRIINPTSYQNPDKIAWSLGGRLQTDFGTFGLYHAGATKYTFEPFGAAGSNTRYGYTYYPDTTYPTIEGGTKPILNEENYIGYLNGENNLSFKAEYANVLYGFALQAGLEFQLSGSKSPANPWHELWSWEEAGQGTKFLDDPVLEKRLTCSLSVKKPLGNWTFSLDGMLGYAWNALELTNATIVDPAAGNAVWIWKPSAGNKLIAELGLGVGYSWKLN
jgi:hypothetical protein